jgi:hypothetical protein
MAYRVARRSDELRDQLRASSFLSGSGRADGAQSRAGEIKCDTIGGSEPM